jgi:chemotaxis protein CheX
MNESELKAFVEIIQHYFSQQSGKSAEMGTPYLADAHALPIFDYTGVIGISGERKGSVYFTAPTELLRQLLICCGEPNTSAENLADLAGEIGNTISGNARKSFGPSFLISVPVVVKGRDQVISMPRNVKSYVIPFRWYDHSASLVVSVV